MTTTETTTATTAPAAEPAAGFGVETPPRRIEYMPLDDIPRAEQNAKAHDEDAIASSLGQFGATVVGILDERTGRLVAGHGRLTVLERQRAAGDAPPDGIRTDADGRWLAPIVRGWASASDPAAAAYVIADNRTTERGGWDNRLLADILDGLTDDPDLLDATGYGADDLDDLVRSFKEPPNLDELGGEYGEPGEDDLWPVLRFKVPPAIKNDFYEVTGGADGDDDASARFIDLIARLKTQQTQSAGARR